MILELTPKEVEDLKHALVIAMKAFDNTGNPNDVKLSDRLELIENRLLSTPDLDILKILNIEGGGIAESFINAIDQQYSYKDAEGLGEHIYSIYELDNIDMQNDEAMNQYKIIVDQCAAVDCGYFRLVNL